MPGRKPLDPGTAGKIRLYGILDGSAVPKKQLPDDATVTLWRAVAGFRDRDGVTRQLERTGTSAAKATRRLKTAIRDRTATANAGILTPESRLADAAPLYLKHLTERQAAGDLSDTSYDRYTAGLNNHVLPGVGQLLLRECTAGRLQQFMDTLRAQGLAANTRRAVRTVLSGLLKPAIAQEVLAANPVASLDDIRGGKVRASKAMTAEQLSEFLTRLDGDEWAVRSDLPDFLRLLFGTGLRFGEALGLRWCDINLSDEAITIDGTVIPPQALWVNGTIVSVNRKGLRRHPTKSDSGNRIIGLPSYLENLLLVRKPLDALDDEPVFPGSNLGWRDTSNVQRAIRRMRERIGYPRFTTHVGRKTVATVLDDAGQSARQIADQLGHAHPSMTMNVYMGRGQFNASAAAELDRVHHHRGGA